MLTTIKTAALAATLALGAFSALPAKADSLGVRIDDGGVGFGVEIGDGYRPRPRFDHYPPPPPPRFGDDGPGFDGPPPPPRFGDYRPRPPQDPRWSPRPDRCNAWRATDKARWMGVRHARVTDVDWDSIEVRGSKRGYPVTVVFGKQRSCPVVGMY